MESFPMMTIEDEEIKLNSFSHSEHFHQSQMEDNEELDTPSNNPAWLNRSNIEEEDCGLPEVTSNPESSIYLQPQSERKASGSSDMKYFGPEMEDDYLSCYGNEMNETLLLDCVDSTTTKTSTSGSPSCIQLNDKQFLPKHLKKKSEKYFDLKTRPNVCRDKQVRTKKETMECDFCGKIFNREKDLIVHMRVHTGEKPFCCDECGHNFRHKSGLNTHMKVHTGEKPFCCDVCGKRFGLKLSIDRHMRIHTGEKPFTCDICEQKFRRKAGLNEHMKIHTGDKPFNCDKCEQKFRHKSHLNRHMRIHTGDKPFRCEECGQRFNQSHHLHNHLRIHTGAKPFSCEVCGKYFRYSYSLKCHMRVHTK